MRWREEKKKKIKDCPNPVNENFYSFLMHTADVLLWIFFESRSFVFDSNDLGLMSRTLVDTVDVNIPRGDRAPISKREIETRNSISDVTRSLGDTQ